MYPSDLKYTKEHEWVKISGAEARVGITDYAQKQLGDVVYLELPEIGRMLTQGDVFGKIESVKSVSELYAPVSGEVTAINQSLTQKPEATMASPGWRSGSVPTTVTSRSSFVSGAASVRSGASRATV